MKKIHADIDIHTELQMYTISGVFRISFRGGFKIFLEKWGYLHGSLAFARGVRGHAPPRKFLKMVQFGAF